MAFYSKLPWNLTPTHFATFPTSNDANADPMDCLDDHSPVKWAGHPVNAGAPRGDANATQRTSTGDIAMLAAHHCGAAAAAPRSDNGSRLSDPPRGDPAIRHSDRGDDGSHKLIQQPMFTTSSTTGSAAHGHAAPPRGGAAQLRPVETVHDSAPSKQERQQWRRHQANLARRAHRSKTHTASDT